MYGREDQCRRRAVAQQLVEEEIGDFARMPGVREAALGRIRVAGQPLEQLFPVGGDDVGLRIMNVRIDETGDDELAGVIDNRRGGGKRRQQRPCISRRDDRAIREHQQAVVEILVCAISALRRIGDEMEERATKRVDPWLMGFDHAHPIS